MKVFALRSGSKGNCTLIQTHKHNILIDVGYSMKRINEDLSINCDINLDDIDFILITHNHSDHIHSFNAVYNKYKDIKFMTDTELKKSIETKLDREYDDDRFIFVEPIADGEDLLIGNFEVQHDTYCLSWIIRDKYDNSGVCFIADNGMFPYKLKDVDLLRIPYTYYLIESNYDKYTQYLDFRRDTRLKRRVLSSKGHSDNFNSVEKFTTILEMSGNIECEGVMFTHLSEDCNSEALAYTSHRAYIETWGHKRLTKNIDFKYAKQNEMVTFD